jgi:hypothetical protein
LAHEIGHVISRPAGAFVAFCRVYRGSGVVVWDFAGGGGTVLTER